VIAVELPSTGSEVRYMPSFHADLPLFALAMPPWVIYLLSTLVTSS
jgi:hypothetical protein